MKDNSIQKNIEEFESLFSIFNQKFYNGELQKPIINVSPDSSRKNSVKCLGWCTTKKVWKNIPDDVIHSENFETGYYEINMCSNYLNRNFTQICATLLHEMVHLWNLQNNISDTSRSGTYHNKNFKIAAEMHGLIINRNSSYGWTITELQPETESFIKELDSNGFTLYRISKKELKNELRQSTRKYVCPICGTIVRATRVVNISCDDCNAIMISEAR